MSIKQKIQVPHRALFRFFNARYLERICDHATYIAAGVAYIAYVTEGKLVKHHHEKLS